MNTTATMQPLQNQTALVIHATTNRGVAMVKALADAGAKVMIHYQDEREKAEQLAEHIRNQQGQAMIFQADISQENQLNSMLDVLMAYWGRLDILVHNLDLQEQTGLQHEDRKLPLCWTRLQARHQGETNNLLGF